MRGRREQAETWKRLALDLLEIVAPSPCIGCRRPTRDWRPQFGLCVPCRGRLRRLGAACEGCAEPIVGATIPHRYRCGACRRSPRAIDRLTAVWQYRPPLDCVVGELKFGGLAFLADDLAAAIAEAINDEIETIDLIVPVPLHWRRFLTRGYNQAGEIARSLATRLDRPVAPALRRVLATRPQSALPRCERSTNPRGAFAVRRRSGLPGAHVGLVDDVTTTGATLDSCARVLKRSGVASVTAIVAARTPPPELL